MTVRIKNMTLHRTTTGTLADVTMAAGYAHGLLAYAVAQGACRDALLAQSGIHPTLLTDHFNRVPLLQYIALLRFAQSRCKDPALAINFGASINCADLSLIALIGAACETVSEAFLMLNRYGRLALDVGGARGDDHYVLRHDERGMWLIDNRQHYGLCPELTETTFTRMVTSVRTLFEPRLVRAVEFAHDAPSHSSTLGKVFGVPVFFACAQSAILFDPAWLTQRIARAPRYSLGVLTERADVLLKALAQTRSTRGRVEAVLLPMLHTGRVSMDHVSALLAMSRPTLYRALRAEQTTFEQVVDAARHMMALQHLRNRKVTVSDVAQKVGFSDPAAFSRAFKRWTGASPKAALRTIGTAYSSNAVTNTINGGTDVAIRRA